MNQKAQGAQHCSGPRCSRERWLKKVPTADLEELKTPADQMKMPTPGVTYEQIVCACCW